MNGFGYVVKNAILTTVIVFFLSVKAAVMGGYYPPLTWFIDNYITVFIILALVDAGVFMYLAMKGDD